jgi:hypothetical protein
MRTNVSHIFAIGDVVGQPMLAHKAVHEGKVAAEVAAGHKRAFDARVIPSVAYTDPEVAWAGMTENEAKAQGVKYGKGVFPWAASGRSLSLGRDEGVTKLLFDEETHRVIGAGIVGPSAGPKRRYRIGSRISVSRVEDTSPPMTTMASGRWISEPGPVANSSGTRPKAAMLAVISTGRSRRLAPSTTTSASGRPSARSWLNQVTMTRRSAPRCRAAR